MTAETKEDIEAIVPTIEKWLQQRGLELNKEKTNIIHVKDGLITKAIDYLDSLGFLVQLGAKVELPGGVVLEMK